LKSTIALGDHLELSGEVASKGSVGVLELNPTLTPDCDAIPGQVSGDAFGLTVAPTINISPYSVGPIGTPNAHKWVASYRLRMPKLQGGQGCGKPQSLVGLLLTDPPGQDTDVEDALLEVWAVLVGSTLPSKFAGALQVGSPSNRAQALKFGSGSGSRRNYMLWVTGKRTLFPYGVSADGNAYTALIETKVSTSDSGSHPHIAGAYVATPEIETSGGATVDNYTTLRVGDAPTDGTTGFESTVRRALRVGKGQSEIEGALSVGSLRIPHSSAPTCSNDPDGEIGDVRWDDDCLYVKTGANEWKRTALSSW
jgi:hypothetical protein